jgi:hypothetical protein
MQNDAKPSDENPPTDDPLNPGRKQSKPKPFVEPQLAEDLATLYFGACDNAGGPDQHYLFHFYPWGYRY